MATSFLIGIAVVFTATLLVVHSLLLVEAIRQIAQIRNRLEMEDRPTPVSLGATTGKQLQSLLAPDLQRRVETVSPGLADGTGLIVFLSSDCTTCRVVADGLPVIMERHRHDIPILPIVDSRHDEGREAFIDASLLTGREVIGDNGEFAHFLGVNVRPMVVTVRGGRIAEAATVRTALQVGRIAQLLTDDKPEMPARLNRDVAIEATH